MTFTHITIKEDGKEVRKYTIDKDNKIKEEVKFDKWFKKLEKEYNEQQENKYY